MISFSVSLSITVNIAIYKFSSRSVNSIIHLGRPFAFNIQSIDSRLINILFIHFDIIASDIATWPCFPSSCNEIFVVFHHRRFFAPFIRNTSPLCFALPLIVIYFISNLIIVFERFSRRKLQSPFTQNYLYADVNFDSITLSGVRRHLRGMFQKGIKGSKVKL